MMKLIRLVIYVFFVHLFFINYVYAHNACTSTPTKYEVTMKKVALCTSSACTTTTVLAEKDGTFDIASASAGADVGSWITGYALEIGTTYTHLQATISSTFTIKGECEDASDHDIANAYCTTIGTPTVAASSGTSPAITVSVAASATPADMSWMVPNKADDDNGSFYGTEVATTFDANGISKVNDATTFTWIGALTSSYTPTATSAPKITLSFDVTNQFQHHSDGSARCGIYVKPPTVAVTLAD